MARKRNFVPKKKRSPVPKIRIKLKSAGLMVKNRPKLIAIKKTARSMGSSDVVKSRLRPVRSTSKNGPVVVVADVHR